MSASMSSRILLRQPTQLVVRQTTRRFASTTEKATETASNAASKAKDTASNVTSKASEGLSRVASSAGSAAKSAAETASNTAAKATGRIGRLIRGVESMIPPTIYYSKVGLELAKLVFQGQKMSPPSVSTFQAYLQPAINAARNPSTLLKNTPSVSSMSPETLLHRVRNMSQAQMVSAGVIVAEVLGFFTVGEMIGRMKLVGYRGEVHHDH